MKSQFLERWGVLCLLTAFVGTSRLFAAEPVWQAPSYHVHEVTRLHIPGPEINPYPIGLGANSQVIYNTYTGAGSHYYLWQPQAQFGRPAGTSLLIASTYNSLAGPVGTGVTSAGRFAELFPSYDGEMPPGLRRWNGNQWIVLAPFVYGSGPRFVTYPFWVLGVNDKGDVAFNYTLYVNFGLPGGAVQLSRAGLWSGSLQNWLPIFPEDTTRAFVLSMNSHGTVCGVYRAANAPGGTPHRGFTATYGTTPIDFVPVGTIGGYSQTHGINDTGEIVGVTGTQGGGVRPFIYLPAAAYGLSSGLHEIGPTMPGYTGTGGGPLPVTARIFINNRGQALLTPGWSPSFYGPSSTNGFLWQRGQRWPLEQLGDVSGYTARDGYANPWHADTSNDEETDLMLALSALRGFNDRGEILLAGASANRDSISDPEYDDVVLLFRPKLTSSLALDKEKIAPGTTNKVRLRLLNEFTAALPAPGVPVLHWDGTNTPTFLSGPTLTTTNASWPPGGTNEWVWTFYFTNETKGIFVAQASAGTNNSALAESTRLRVLDQADLWVRATNEAAWRGNDFYDEAVAPSQTREKGIQPTETAAFDVRVQNDSERSREFTLKAVASGDAGWIETYRQGATDVSATITNVGLNLGTLARGTFIDLTVTLRGTNTLPTLSRREIVFTGRAVSGDNGADTVKVAAEVMNEIIVNSTGDEPDASLIDDFPDVNTNKTGLQTTLRCAIDFANRRAGKDVIKFDIEPTGNVFEDGVPTILPLTALPDITDTLIVDGWSQQTNSSTPPVVLCGKSLPRPPRPAESTTSFHVWPGAIPALVLMGDGCELRGLCINQFPTGVELAGGGSHVVEGCFFGTDASGIAPKGNGLAGALSSFSPTQALREPDLEFYYALSPQTGWDIKVSSPFNRIGGGGVRAGNLFGSMGGFVGPAPSPPYPVYHTFIIWPVALWMSGPSALGNAVAGNLFGTKANGVEPIAEQVEGLPLLLGAEAQWYSYANIEIENASGNQIGLGSAEGGNVFVGGLAGVYVNGQTSSGNSIVGNSFCVSRNGAVRFYSWLNAGVFAQGCDLLTIGGSENLAGNNFGPTKYSIVLGSTKGIVTVEGNIFGTDASDSLSRQAVTISGSSGPINVTRNTFKQQLRGVQIDNRPVTPNPIMIATNFFQFRNKYLNSIAVAVTSGNGATIVGNSFIGGAASGVVRLGENLDGDAVSPPLPNDEQDSDTGPNTLLNWPEITRAQLADGQLDLEIIHKTTPLTGPYIYHVYRCAMDQWNHGQPWPGAIAVVAGSANAGGNAGFAGILPTSGELSHRDYLCAIATGPDGSSSEVGLAFEVKGGPDSDGDGKSNAAESGAPNRYAQNPGLGDGNGDNLADEQQANVLSLTVVASNWLTIATSPSVTFSNAQLSGIPALTNVPPDFTFPLGFVAFTLNGLTPGATVSLTNILHDPVTISNVFAFGPTPGNTQPHWYALNPAIIGDEVRLTFTDGGTGDHDLSANGIITTLYAVAYRLPPTPQLTLLSSTPGTVSIVVPDGSGTNSTFVTNAYSSVECALAWPATATNYIVEFTSSLSPPDWFPLAGAAVVIGDQLVVTNLSLAPTRFYRLRPGQ